MAVKRNQNWLSQQRVDTPHLRSIESAVRNDFDEMFAAFVLGESNSYVIRGFDIEMAGSIGASANGLQLIVEDSAILHGASNESGTFFELPPGEPNQVLSATTNVRVEGAFTPGALNYVSLEFTRQVDDTTTDQIYLWNPTTQSEITKTLPLAETLDYKIVISSSLFTSNVLPISIVETDASNNVLSIQDRRPMLFRLGTAGSATPDPFYEYAWDNHTEGRSENFWQSSSSTSSPFRGGDKQIRTFKENDEALKTEIKQIKGTTYWYSANNAGSLTGIRYDLGNTIFTGRGYIEHNAGNPGQINWDEDMFLTVVTTRLKYKLEANVATTNIDLDDDQVAYVTLIRDVGVIPQLVFTNGADEVTSVGAIAWTSDLEAGDYVKVGAEDDSSYYQILTVDSASKVTLTENFGGTSTGVNGTDAKIAYGNYRTDAAPSTDRHIRVANINEVPFDKDVYWLFLRSDNAGQARVYLRFLNAELEVGEQIQISDQVPAAVLAYMGSANDSDADPAYGTIAPDTITASSNYNSVNGENLTIRASKLTSMMASKAQDKTIQLVSNHTSVSNTTNAAAQEITFAGGSGTATAIIPSSANNGTIGLSGTLSLEANQVAYYQVDRNAAFSLADLTELTVADISAVPLDEKTFIFAYRLTGSTVYLWNNSVLESGSSIALSVLRGYVQQNKTVKLIKGGTWSWDSVSNELINSASAFVQVGGLADTVNEIAAQTISLTADGQVAYVTLKRSAGASTLTVNTADIASVPVDDHTFIIARRTNDEVIVGTSSFALENRDYLTLDGAKAEIDRRLDQLKVQPAQPLSTRVVISSSDIVQLNGSKLSLEQQNLLLAFDGAQIDFNTGEVFESDGSTPLNGGINDFTPFVIPASEYFWYSVTLLPNTTNADNTISGQILIIPASASNAALVDAPKAPFSSTGIKLANVYVQKNAGNTAIENINFANIVSLGVGGSGGGGTGDANELLERLKNRINSGTFEYMTPVIYSSTQDDLVDGISTATFSIVNSNFEFGNIGDELISIQMLDNEFLNPVNEAGNPIDPVPLNKVELIHYWDLEALDDLATYEVSRDGGNEWQIISMSRIGQSDTYRGIHNFAIESANSYSQTIGGAQTGTSIFTNLNEFSRIFALANTSTIRKVTANITKTGSPTGYIYAVAVKDDGLGSPSTDLADEITRSNFIDISTLVTGSVDFNLEFTQIAEDYHIVFKTDDLYKASYGAGVDEIAIDNDGSGIIYDIEGIELDLRVRITSGTVDVASQGFGIFYKQEEIISLTDNILRHQEQFVGDVDNEDTFTLSFLPDPRLLVVYEIETGQAYRYGAFVLNGNQVIFEPNTFNKPQTVTLEFLQINGTSFDNSDANIALLSANHLGSTDANIDLSVAGRGIFLRRPDGILREISIDDDDNIQIWSI